MGLYKLKEKVGSHNEEGKNYEAGSIVESKKDLVKIFPFKFEKVEPIPSEPKADKPLESPKSKVENVGESIDFSKIKSKLGENVTSDYPTAQNAYVIVLKKGIKYVVADPDMPDRALNDKPLTEAGLLDWLESNRNEN